MQQNEKRKYVTYGTSNIFLEEGYYSKDDLIKSIESIDQWGEYAKENLFEWEIEETDEE